MNSQLTVETITEQINKYNNIAFVLLVASIAMLITAIVLFIALNIPHSIRVLTGMGMSKEINKKSKDAKSGKSSYAANHKATVSWSNSGNLNNSGKVTISGKLNKTVASMDMGDEATTVLGPDDPTTILDDQETTLLSSSDETTLLVDEATTLLANFRPRAAAPSFEFGEDIKITGSRQRIRV